MTEAANSVEGKAKPYLERVENKLEELATLRSEYMNECKAHREDIKEIYNEAKANGVPAKALKGLVEYRILEARQAKIGAGLDLDEQSALENLIIALGPLGQAAADRARAA